MRPNNIEQSPLEEPLVHLERQLVDAYLAGAGENLDDLMARDDEAAHQLLTAASLYASERLSEIESSAHLRRTLHGSE
jgi:hypothetical protein